MKIVKRHKFFLLPFSLLVIFIMMQGAIMAPDSAGYMSYSQVRPPAYSILAYFLGNSFLLFFLQLILGIYSVIAFAKTFKKIFELDKIAYYLIILVLFLPYIGKNGNYILSEALAYPLFLLVLSSLIDGLLNNKKLTKYYFYSYILMLTRGQFLFLPILNIVISFFKKDKKMFFCSFLLILVFVLSEKTYHYVRGGNFISSTGTGIHLSIPGFYIADKNQNISPIVTEILQEIDNKKLSLKYHAGRVNPPHHYYASFDKILYEIVYPVFDKHGMTEPIVVNAELFKIAKELILTNFFKYTELVFKNIFYNLGGYFYSILVCFSLLFGFYKKNDSYGIILFVLSLMAICNASTLSLLQVGHVRYTFYTQIPLVICYILGIYKFYGQYRSTYPVL